MVACGLVTSVIWLPFVTADQALHPEVPALPWLRAGLTLVSLAVLAVHLRAPGWMRPQVRMQALVGYLQVVGAICAGLSGADPAYLGGYFIILMLMPALPLSRMRAFTTMGASVSAFALTTHLTNTSLADPALRYSLTDLMALAVGAPFLVVVLNRVRRRSWEQTIEIGRQQQELASDKARIDELLHNILPAPIVTELKATDRVLPRRHAEVSVLFTDFCGFTRVAEDLPAEDLVAALDVDFSAFDEIVARRGLEKLKTIGDSYMAAAGVPTARRSNAADAVLAGLEMARVIAAHSAARRGAGRPGWEVRIGIHTGSLVAGVVGRSRFAYDVWGTTVNLASRLEATAEPGRVNISASTAARVADLFLLERRGHLPVKHKGRVEMYFVAGIRPELSIDGAGLEPAEGFWERARRE